MHVPHCIMNPQDPKNTVGVNYRAPNHRLHFFFFNLIVELPGGKTRSGTEQLPRQSRRT